MHKLSTYFVLFAEFGTAHVPVEAVGAKYFSFKPDHSKRLASKNKFPIPAFRAGDQKSPWIVNIEDLARHLDEKNEKARTEYKATH